MTQVILICITASGLTSGKFITLVCDSPAQPITLLLMKRPKSRVRWQHILLYTPLSLLGNTRHHPKYNPQFISVIIALFTSARRIWISAYPLSTTTQAVDPSTSTRV